MLPAALAPCGCLSIASHSPPTCPRADAQLANELGCSFFIFDLDPRSNGNESGVTMIINVTLASSSLTGLLLLSLVRRMRCACASEVNHHAGFGIFCPEIYGDRYNTVAIIHNSSCIHPATILIGYVARNFVVADPKRDFRACPYSSASLLDRPPFNYTQLVGRCWSVLPSSWLPGLSIGDGDYVGGS